MAVQHSDGVWREYPQQPDPKYARYSPRTVCEVCGFESPRYCVGGACVVCARSQSMAFYRLHKGFENPFHVVVGAAPVVPTGDAWGTLGKLLESDREKYFIQYEPCTKAGHIGVRYVHNGRCVMCHIDNPRQRAIAVGEKWYESDELCSCGKKIWKYVLNARKRPCKCEEGR